MSDSTQRVAATTEPPAQTQVTRHTLWASADVIGEFERLLSANDIHPARDSPLERAFLALLELRDRLSADGTVTDSAQSIDALCRRIAHGLGVLSLIRLLLPALSTPFLSEALPHLRLLATPGASGAQNVRANPTDQATQKLFELMIGAAVSRFASAVTLDPPSGGGDGENPDVLCTHGGVRWGLACKTIHGNAPHTLADRICEGVQQIVDSDAERGLVVLNFYNVLPYERFSSHVDGGGNRVTVRFDEAKEALAITREFIGERITAADAATQAEGWRARLYVDLDGASVPKTNVALLTYTEITIQVNAPDGRPAWQQAIEVGFVGLAPPEVDAAASKFIDELIAAMKRGG